MTTTDTGQQSLEVPATIAEEPGGRDRPAAPGCRPAAPRLGEKAVADLLPGVDLAAS